MNSIEQLKQIIENAPDGATHFDSDLDYYYRELTEWKWYLWDSEDNKYILSSASPNHSLSDIKTIVELEEQKRSFAAAFYECYDELRDLVNMQQGNPHVHNAEKIVYNLAVKFDDANELMP